MLLRALKLRTDAIDEIPVAQSAYITVLRAQMRKLPDLARGLCRIQYGKVRPLSTFMTDTSQPNMEYTVYTIRARHTSPRVS